MNSFHAPALRLRGVKIPLVSERDCKGTTFFCICKLLEENFAIIFKNFYKSLTMSDLASNNYLTH